MPAIQEHVRGLVERLLGRAGRARCDRRGAASRPARRHPLDGCACARRRARRRGDRRLGAGLEPPRLAPSLQHRRRRRRRSRRAEAVPPAPALAVPRRSAARRREQVRLEAVERGNHHVARAVAERTTSGRARRDRRAVGSVPPRDRLRASFFVVAVSAACSCVATAVLQGRAIRLALEPRLAARRAAPRCDRRRVGPRRPDRLGRQARDSRDAGATAARRRRRPARAGRWRPGERLPPPSSHAGGEPRQLGARRVARQLRAAGRRCG